MLPSADLVLVDRADGGNLVVNPPREVWERGELSGEELRLWACLVAAAGGAMLQTLPQLQGGCINYWEAGNWALNNDAPPAGHKEARQHRMVHLHLLGRSPQSTSASWKWGEAPFFPPYAERKRWAASHRRLMPSEVRNIVVATMDSLTRKYGFAPNAIERSLDCTRCAYPIAASSASGAALCPTCAS
ncbi:MAG: hypothetical protein KBA31_18075 [Alphaproteobacteria bacterium]|nr:hypothetical protein [Alphaproteobacteria bacterium]